MDDIEQLTRQLEGLVVQKKRKVRTPKAEQMNVEVAPVRRMLRATRNRTNASTVQASALMDLPLERTPSAASSDVGKPIISAIKSAIRAHRKIRTSLEAFGNAMLEAQRLFTEGKHTQAQSILRENKSIYDDLVRMSDNIQYAGAHIVAYREKVESLARNAVFDRQESYGKLRSFFIKHQAEMKTIYDDAYKYHQVAKNTYTYIEQMKKEQRMMRDVMNSMSFFTLGEASPTEGRKKRTKRDA